MFQKKNAFNNNNKSIINDIDKPNQRKENRRTKEEKKLSHTLNPKDNIKLFDEDYAKMIHKKQTEIYQNLPKSHITGENHKIFVVVRKKPLSNKEISNGEIDCISSLNPKIVVHECKMKIDGITKYLEDHEFYYDNTFSENNTTEEVYDSSIGPMIDLVLNKGIVTCFAYGQTGSGKTYTMKGIQNKAIDDLYLKAKEVDKQLVFYISFFEIYGGRLYDLLNNKNKLQVLDDKNGKVQIFGLEELLAETPDEMRMIIDQANAIRTTHNTVTNETSSRSHAICNIVVKEIRSNEEYGKLSLIDLAGSERAQETQSNNRQRIAEGAEINKSLLALKECIRALDDRKNGNTDKHVPFRASKLTHVLRDSFLSKSNKSKIIMIACVNPSYNSANHSINTLRYSDRLKKQTSTMSKSNNYVNSNPKQYNFSHRIQTVPSSKTTNDTNSDKTHHSDKQSNDFIREIEDINSNVYNSQDDNLCDIDFEDKIDLNKDSLQFDQTKQDLNRNVNDLMYLTTTVTKNGKQVNDDFIRYHQLTELILDEEDDLLNTHMDVIKDDAKMLTEEGELITRIKHLGIEKDFKMDEYLLRLEEIINHKVAIYSELQDKLGVYNHHLKEEDKMRKEHPLFLIDNGADV